MVSLLSMKFPSSSLTFTGIHTSGRIRYRNNVTEIIYKLPSVKCHIVKIITLLSYILPNSTFNTEMIWLTDCIDCCFMIFTYICIMCAISITRYVFLFVCEQQMPYIVITLITHMYVSRTYIPMHNERWCDRLMCSSTITLWCSSLL